MWLALSLALTGAGCPYVRSAVRQAFDDGPPAIRVEGATLSDGTTALPAGTVRSLSDEVFSPETADLGFFNPREFMARAPLLFYALEEPQPGKIPVLFVHGMRGSARDFAPLVERLDRSRYQPWFFQYPSGADLGQLSEAFHRLFLSGKVVRSGPSPMVVVAHSVGGLIVREALNRCTGIEEESRVVRLVTLASPMGGLSAAGGAADGVVVIRAWRDLDPQSPFIQALHRRPLPTGLEYSLLFAFANGQKVKMGENSDGIVPLSSQLAPSAQAEARTEFGFNTTHAGILRDPDAIQRVLALVGEAGTAPPAAGSDALSAEER